MNALALANLETVIDVCSPAEELVDFVEKEAAKDRSLNDILAERPELRDKTFHAVQEYEELEPFRKLMEHDDFDGGLQKLFTENPSEVVKHAINKARRGCITSFMVITETFREQKCPVSILPEALDMFANKLNNNCRHGEDEVSFIVLSETLSVTFPSLRDPPLEPVLRAWSSITAWANTKLIEKKGSSKKIVEGLAALLAGINQFNKNKDVRNLCFRPDTLKLAVHVFLHPPDPKEDHLLEAIHYAQHYVDVNTSLAGNQLGGTEKALDEILGVLEGNPELLLDPMFDLLTEASPVLAFLCIVFFILIALPRSHHPLSTALKKKGPVYLSKYLSRLTDLPAENEKDASEYLECCIALFASHWSFPDGRNWLLQALQSRIFHVIALSSRCRSWSELRTLLSSVLPLNLCDPDVVFACENALSSFSAEDHKHMMSTGLGLEWKVFLHRFFSQYIFYCYFEAAGFRKGCYNCGRTSKGGKPVTLSRCGACKTVEYCSKACQTGGWKDHKVECKTLRGKKYGPLPRWAVPWFRRQLAAHDARRHLPGLRQLAKEFPCLPFQCVRINIDYTIYPPRMSVTPANIPSDTSDTQDTKEKEKSSFSSESESNLSSHEGCFDDFRLHDGSSSLLQVRQHVNEEVTTTTQMFYWTPPYFASEFGSKCPNIPDNLKNMSLPPTAYSDDHGKMLEVAWSVVEEIRHRSGLSPQMILEGKIGEFRKKVLEVVLREKATIPTRTPAKINLI